MWAIKYDGGDERGILNYNYEPSLMSDTLVGLWKLWALSSEKFIETCKMSVSVAGAGLATPEAHSGVQVTKL
jgi:hypothetical protein